MLQVNAFRLLPRGIGYAPTTVPSRGLDTGTTKCACLTRRPSRLARFPPRHLPSPHDNERSHCRRPHSVPAGNRPAQAPHAGGRGAARKTDRARRRAGERADDQREPSPGRIGSQALPGSRNPAARPRPGGNDRPDPSQREVRLAAWHQVLDLRDVVDPASDRPGGSGIRQTRFAPRFTSTSAGANSHA